MKNAVKRVILAANLMVLMLVLPAPVEVRLKPFSLIVLPAMVKVPVSACGTLPETGASSISAPLPRTRAARSTLTSGLTVLMST